MQLLGLQKELTCVPLSGLGATAARGALSISQLFLSYSIELNFQLRTKALILHRLTSQLPVNCIRDLDFKQFAKFHISRSGLFFSNKVGVILRANIYGQLLRSGLKHFPSSQLVAQNTANGWIVSGTLQAED